MASEEFFEHRLNPFARLRKQLSVGRCNRPRVFLPLSIKPWLSAANFVNEHALPESLIEIFKIRNASWTQAQRAADEATGF